MSEPENPPLVATCKLHIGDHYYLSGDAVPPESEIFENYAELVRSGALVEGTPESDTPRGEGAKLRAHIRLEKYDGGDESAARAADPNVAPDEVVERDDNLLMYGGVSDLFQLLIGNGTTTAGQALTYFSNARAAIGVGDSSTAAAATQTDLQAASNKTRVAMDATYPTHTDATTSGAATITFRATFDTSTGNWAWNEWGVFNSSTAATGRMLNRKVESLGTKPNTQTWQFTVTLTLA